jgi:hypothetical protein
MHPNRVFAKRWLLLQIPFFLFVLLYALAYAYAKETGSDLFRCRISESLHIYCPGCGGTRSLSHLIRFDFYSAIICYPPIAVIFFFYFDLNLRAVLSIIRDEATVFKSFNMNYLILIPVFILLNFFVRNILLFLGVDMLGDLSEFYGLI